MPHSAVELRRRIGTKEISPVELLEACIARIERINPAVNAVTATCYDRAREEAKAAEKAALRGEALGLLHGLPTGIKDLDETGGLLTTYGSPLYRDFVPERDNAMVARVRAAGADRRRQDQRARIRRGRELAQRRVGRDRQSVRSRRSIPAAPPAARPSRSRRDMLPVCTGSDTGGSLRIPAAKCGVVGFRPSPGLVPVERRALGWTPISVVGPMGRTVADTCLLLAAQAAMDDCDPLSYPVDARAFAVPEPRDLGALRVAYTEDFDISPVDKPIRDVFRDRIEAMRHLFRSCDEVAFDFRRGRPLLRRDPRAELRRALSRRLRERPELARPQRARELRDRREACRWPTWPGRTLEQTRIFRRFQQTFRDYDLVLAPTTPVSPFPWTQLYLAEMDGKPLRNYYHWLSLTYVVTLATNPAISMPCGVDHKGMPFGLQVVGPFRADRALLGAAHAMEQAFAAIPALRRPVPDLGKLTQPTPALKSIVTHPPKAGTPMAAAPA